MNRADLQRLSTARIREAKILLKAGEYNGAYYLAGYAVECALKACIAKRVRKYDFPDKTLAQDSYVHDLSKLAGLAYPNKELTEALRTNPVLEAKWNLTRVWSEQSRYSFRTQNDAAAIIEAITKRDGVLSWIKRHW
ncbi:MAG: HEPN domain-containing protein [Acidobacteria bacterium]|nr:HEPN domain-containing protein [Acidobacteriota bacterium]